MYRQTYRNKLGISKTINGEGVGAKGKNNKFNWIDLFNIGNVMLMRG